MPLETHSLHLSYHNTDGSVVLEEYIEYIANKNFCATSRLSTQAGRREKASGHIL